MGSVVGFDLQGLLQDRYRIEREVARGGMATVFLATELKHDRQVAIRHYEVAMRAYRLMGDVHYQLHLKRDPGLRWLKVGGGRHLLLPDPPKL